MYLLANLCIEYVSSKISFCAAGNVRRRESVHYGHCHACQHQHPCQHDRAHNAVEDHRLLRRPLAFAPHITHAVRFAAVDVDWIERHAYLPVAQPMLQILLCSSKMHVER